MYPDQIKNYTTEQQFKDHQRMLDDMKEHFKSHYAVSNPTLENLRKEEQQLKLQYRKWLRKQRA